MSEDLFPTHEGWPGDAETCPADRDFLVWLSQAATNFVIRVPPRVLHVGPGEHHVVGSYIATALQGETLALTISPDEVQSYIAMIRSHPMLTLKYQVMFADQFAINSVFLPRWFDVINLPHLGEMPDPRRAAYTLNGEREVILQLLERLTPGGFITFYSRSAAADRVLPAVEKLAHEGWFQSVPSGIDGNTTLAFRKP